MNLPNYIVYYVENPTKSGQFYAELFDGVHHNASDNYSIVQLKNGIKLGFWSKKNVVPTTDGIPGSTELFVTVNNKDDVDKCYALWKQRQIDIIQEPTDVGFGYTFVGCCPEGHRLRVGYIFE